MRYLVLTHMSQRTWDELSAKERSAPEELEAIGAFLQEFVADLTESGELVDSGGLSAPADAQVIKLRGGAPVVTEGPYAEDEEVVAGYWLLECASLDRATEVATRLTRSGPLPESGVVVRALV